MFIDIDSNDFHPVEKETLDQMLAAWKEDVCAEILVNRQRKSQFVTYDSKTLNARVRQATPVLTDQAICPRSHWAPLPA